MNLTGPAPSFCVKAYTSWSAEGESNLPYGIAERTRYFQTSKVSNLK